MNITRWILINCIILRKLSGFILLFLSSVFWTNCISTPGYYDTKPISHIYEKEGELMTYGGIGLQHRISHLQTGIGYSLSNHVFINGSFEWHNSKLKLSNRVENKYRNGVKPGLWLGLYDNYGKDNKYFTALHLGFGRGWNKYEHPKNGHFPDSIFLSKTKEYTFGLLQGFSYNKFSLIFDIYATFNKFDNPAIAAINDGGDYDLENPDVFRYSKNWTYNFGYTFNRSFNTWMIYLRYGFITGPFHTDVFTFSYFMPHTKIGVKYLINTRRQSTGYRETQL